MRQVPNAEFALMVLQAAILAGLFVRVLVTGFFRKYPYFIGYVVVALLQSLILSFLSPASLSYVWPYVITQAALTCAGALVLLELYDLVFRDLKGIAGISRRYLKICLGLAIVASLLLLQFEQISRRPLGIFGVIDRAVVTSMLLFVLALAAFLVYYPVPINRNVIVYSIGYTVYFLAKASGLLLLNGNYAWLRPYGLVVVSASTLSMLFWLVGLRLAGEEKTLIVGHRWNRENQDEMLAQLKAINDSLLRSGRR
jgi:hypothetical protein